MLGAQAITFHLKHFTFLLFIFIIIYCTEPRVYLNSVALTVFTRTNHQCHIEEDQENTLSAAPIKSPETALLAISHIVFWIKPKGLRLQGRVCDLSCCMIWYLLCYLFTVVLIISIVVIHRSKCHDYLKCVTTYSLNKYSHQGTPDEWHDLKPPEPQLKGWSQSGHSCIDDSWNRKCCTEQVYRGFGEWRRTSSVSNMFLFELYYCLCFMGNSEAFKKIQLYLRHSDELEESKAWG